MTGIHRDTVMRLGVRVGQGCTKIMDAKMLDLLCEDIQIDEIWGFIGKKKKNVAATDTGVGGVWTFIALDRAAHGCEAVHVVTEAVHEHFRGQSVWTGHVEVFSLRDHPQAKTCYAWSYQDGPIEHFATVLEVPPVKNALDAVRAHIVGEVRKRKED